MENTMLWSNSDKGDFITCTEQKFLKFTGDVDGNSQASAIRTLDNLPSDKITYFEIGVVNGGRTNGIAIGISPNTTGTSRLPGWDADTIGYHGGEQGGIFHENSSSPVEETSQFQSGDIIGCLIEPFNSDKRTAYFIQFSKNGENVGTERIIKNSEVYPTVALFSKNAEVITNFGNKRLEWKGSFGKGNYLITL